MFFWKTLFYIRRYHFHMHVSVYIYSDKKNLSFLKTNLAPPPVEKFFRLFYPPSPQNFFSPIPWLISFILRIIQLGRLSYYLPHCLQPNWCRNRPSRQLMKCNWWKSSWDNVSRWLATGRWSELRHRNNRRSLELSLAKAMNQLLHQFRQQSLKLTLLIHRIGLEKQKSLKKNGKTEMVEC